MSREYPAKCTEEEPIEWMGDHELGKECPVLLLHRMEVLFTGYSWAERGVLPQGGGWREQPYLWMKAFQVIGTEVAIMSKERVENMKPGQA